MQTRSFCPTVSILVLSVSAALCQAPDWRNGIVQVAAGGKSPGAGFVVALSTGRAYVVTCAHVVGGDQFPSVTFNADPDKQRYRSEVRDSNRRTDLALLVVERPPGNVHVVEPGFGSTSEGTDALIAGYPGETGARFTVLRGAIASVSGAEISISPATEEGFSGGPVVADGRVIGVVFEHTRTYGKAIPAGIVQLYLSGLDVRWGTGSAKAEGPKAEFADTRELAAGTVRVNAKDGLKYVWIPPGRFRMGCSPGDAECRGNEPTREVTIPRGFWIGQTEVTQAAYELVTGDNPSLFEDGGLPVSGVDWEQARAYCGKVGMRLPTEGEWEYAARGGDPNALYGERGAIAWYGANAVRPHPVAQKQANGWGLYDMLGNVNEWTSDVDPNVGAKARIVRGGYYGSTPNNVRVSYRDWAEASARMDLGIRCAGELR